MTWKDSALDPILRLGVWRRDSAGFGQKWQLASNHAGVTCTLAWEGTGPTAVTYQAVTTAGAVDGALAAFLRLNPEG